MSPLWSPSVCTASRGRKSGGAVAWFSTVLGILGTRSKALKTCEARIATTAPYPFLAVFPSFKEEPLSCPPTLKAVVEYKYPELRQVAWCEPA